MCAVAFLSARKDDVFGYCLSNVTGGRSGWRLPTIQELESLNDHGALPAGHPFTNVQPGYLAWSATSAAQDASLAWVSAPLGGAAAPNVKTNL